jgi:transcriptional regulator with XRE-family HTH domain
MQTQKDKLSQLLKKTRGATSQREFSKRIGISLAGLQGWEDARALPSTENLAKIAVACGMTFLDLSEYLNGRNYDQDDSVEYLISRINTLGKDEFSKVVTTVIERLLRLL